MKNGFGLRSLVPAFLATALASMVLVVPLVAQTTSEKAFTFGSSLKRSKTDTNKQINSEAKSTPVEDGMPRPDDTIRVDTSLVVIDVLVTDASGSRHITGLTRDDFVVGEDGQQQEIATFTLGDDAARLPRSVVLILDRSGSELPYIEDSIEAAKRLIGQLAPTDEVAIVTDDVQLAIGFTKDKKKLKQTLDSLKKLTLKGYHTRSMQFSALLATLRELIDVKKRRPIIIFQTDGDEAGRLSRWAPIAGEQLPSYAYGMEDVYAEVENSRTKIYTVIPNDRLIGIQEEEIPKRVNLMMEKRRVAKAKYKDMWYGYERVPPKTNNNPTVYKITGGNFQKFREKMFRRTVDTFVQGQAAAARVAELTGGWTSFLEKPKQADEIYGRILTDINHRYVVGYYPTNRELNGQLRKVRIEVRGHPDYVIQGRRSYHAVPQQ